MQVQQPTDVDVALLVARVGVHALPRPDNTEATAAKVVATEGNLGGLSDGVAECVADGANVTERTTGLAPAMCSLDGSDCGGGGWAARVGKEVTQEQ